MYKNNKIGVVIPAYNEERFIASVIEAVPDFVDRIYVVNDASTDATAEIVATRYNNGRVALINHRRNRGVGAAIVTGYQRVLEETIDIAVVMAGDNQMDPAQMVNLLAPVIEGKADYCKGNRLSQFEHLAGMSKWRRFGNYLLTWLTRIAAGNWRLSDPQNGYTAVTQKALRGINLDSIYPNYGYCNDILVKLAAYGYRVIDVAMPARYGNEKSKIRYHKYIPKVAWLLLKGFLWRISAGHSRRNGR